MNNFIKLKTDRGKTVIINVSQIASFKAVEISGKTFTGIQMCYESKTTYNYIRAAESLEDILEMIQDQNQDPLASSKAFGFYGNPNLQVEKPAEFVYLAFEIGAGDYEKFISAHADHGLAESAACLHYANDRGHRMPASAQAQLKQESKTTGLEYANYRIDRVVVEG